MFEKRQGEIYRIWFINDPSGKSYIGQTVTGARNRVRQHIAEAFDGNKGGCPLLDKATRKFGSDNMRFEILSNNIYTREALDAAEKFWIREYNSQAPNGYNVKAGGQGGDGGYIPAGSNNIGVTGIFENPIAAYVARSVLDKTTLSSQTKGFIGKVLGL